MLLDMTGIHRGEASDTSERLNPDFYLSRRSDAFIYACHLATYDFSVPYVGAKRVLDFGCGTGYGTHRIAAECDRIVGVDVSHEAIAEAKRCFEAEGLVFQQIGKVEIEPLPFLDDEFDVVLSFQVFEHINEPDAYLREVRRVLAPGGIFICVTPDRGSRLFSRQRPWNEFHVREYSPSEMSAILLDYFASVEVAGMTARADLLKQEMRRVNMLRWATYAVTFPGVPEHLRVGGLRLVKKLRTRRNRQAQSEESPSLDRWGFDESDISVFSLEKPSLNVVCVAS